MSKYLTSWLNPLAIVLTLLCLAQGGWWMWLPFVLQSLFYVLGDAWLPHALDEPRLRQAWLLNLPCYAILPLLLALNALLLWLLGSGDVGGLGAWLLAHTPLDLFAARAATDHAAMWLGGALSAALCNATGGTIAAHELTHRTHRPLDLLLGRWMLAFTFDTSFAIEHVYGHHARVATFEDPASARRGESFYRFALRSTVHSFLHAWALERERLAKFNRSPWDPVHNRFLRGQLANLSLFVPAFVLAGWAGLAFWALVAFIGKQFLEVANYFEHYGLVRVPGQPVEPRHSWNSNHWVSSHVMFSLARHSHHHAAAELPYWELRAYPDAPQLPYGYLTMFYIAMVPAWFEHVMAPALQAWDTQQASPAERELLAQRG